MCFLKEGKHVCFNDGEKLNMYSLRIEESEMGILMTKTTWLFTRDANGPNICL